MGEERVFLYNDTGMRVNGINPVREKMMLEIDRITRDQFNNYLGSYMYRFRISHLIIHRCQGATGLYQHLKDIEEKNKDKPIYLKLKPGN